MLQRCYRKEVMNIKDLTEEAGYAIKRKAACHGGEYCSPCPFCKDGKDRFLIWPNRSNKDGSYQGGRFACRVCGKYGDAIAFLRELHGISYKDACARLKLEVKTFRAPFIIRSAPSFQRIDDPPIAWQTKAEKFIEWSHQQLIQNPNALALLRKRGFNSHSITAFKLGFNPKRFYRELPEWGLKNDFKEDGTPRKLWLPIGITIPTFSSTGKIIKIKIRRSDWKEDDRLPKYIEVSGSKRSPSIYGNRSLPVCLILESELDGLLIQQLASDLLYCIALGGSTKSIDYDTHQVLRKTKTLLFCPDFDKAGASAWVKWKKMFPSIQRILTPNGKAPGDALESGIDLGQWIINGLTFKENL